MDDFQHWREIDHLFQKPLERLNARNPDRIVKPVAGDGFYKVYGTVSNGFTTQYHESGYERVSRCRCQSPEQAAIYGCTYCQRTNALKLARTYWDCTEQERRAGS